MTAAHRQRIELLLAERKRATPARLRLDVDRYLRATYGMRGGALDRYWHLHPYFPFNWTIGHPRYQRLMRWLARRYQ